MIVTIESQIINATGKTIINVTATPDSNPLPTYLLVVATIGIAVATWYMATSNRNQLRDQHYKSGLLDVFSIINSSSHKNAEREIIEAYRDNNRLYNGQMMIPEFREQLNTISHNYDQVGLLVQRNLVPRDDYFHMFGTLTVVYHHILFMEIDRHRQALGERDFRTYFTKLAIDCYQYWEKRNRIPFDPLTGRAIPHIALQQWQASLPE